MNKPIIRTALALGLAGFFLLGAYNNGFPAPQTVASYQRWGYPPFFHYFTAALELSAAVFIAVPRYRIAGTALGALIMGAAIGTLMMHGAANHIMTPLFTLITCLAAGAMTLRARRASAALG